MPKPSVRINTRWSDGPIRSTRRRAPAVSVMPPAPASEAVARAKSTRLSTSGEGLTSSPLSKAASSLSASLEVSDQSQSSAF